MGLFAEVDCYETKNTDNWEIAKTHSQKKIPMSL